MYSKRWRAATNQRFAGFAPAAQPISGFTSGWVSTSELLAVAGMKTFAGSDHLLYILQGVCCGFTERSHGRLCPILPVLSSLSWSSLVMRDSSEELRPVGLRGKPQKSSHSPWVLTREGKYKNSDWQKTNCCWVRALCHCLL